MDGNGSDGPQCTVILLLQLELLLGCIAHVTLAT